MRWLYEPPWWLPGGHVQTIGAAWWGRRAATGLTFHRERLTTPDGDFVDVDQLDGSSLESVEKPLLVLFHGLEGSSASHYALAFASQARHRGWRYVVPHFRGCSGEINLAPRAYHSGDAAEIGWMLQEIRARHGGGGPVWAVGVSLGGNALLRWAQEAGAEAARVVDAVVAICSPLDLMAAGKAIDRGVNRQLYARMFLRTMKRKARQKWSQYPGLFDLDKALRAQTLEAFDDVFTAPLHGYRGVTDYWTRASSRHRLKEIQLPALVLNARNDPFVPSHSLPGPGDVSDRVCLWQPDQGGHVGFAHRGKATTGRAVSWMALDAMPSAVCDWLMDPKGGAHG